jgi:hypothetical protein
MKKIEFVAFGVVLVLLLAIVPIVSYSVNPPKIIVSDEKNKDIVPSEVKDFKTEMVVSGTFGDTAPPLKVILTVREIFHTGLYIIKVSVKNLGNKRLSLGIPPTKGGFIVYNESGKEVYHAPEYTILTMTRFVLRPYQHKTLFMRIWDVKSLGVPDITFPTKYTIYGFMFGYEYNGEQYPSIESFPITIYP